MVTIAATMTMVVISAMVEMEVVEGNGQPPHSIPLVDHPLEW
jgi:hypothetical protein